MHSRHDATTAEEITSSQEEENIDSHQEHLRILEGTPHWWGMLGTGSLGSTHT